MTAVFDYVVKGSEYVDRVEQYSSERNITRQRMKEALKTRYTAGSWLTWGQTLDYFNNNVDHLATKNIRDIGMIRYLHALLKKDGR